MKRRASCQTKNARPSPWGENRAWSNQNPVDRLLIGRTNRLLSRCRFPVGFRQFQRRLEPHQQRRLLARGRVLERVVKLPEQERERRLSLLRIRELVRLEGLIERRGAERALCPVVLCALEGLLDAAARELALLQHAGGRRAVTLLHGVAECPRERLVLGLRLSLRRRWLQAAQVRFHRRFGHGARRGGGPGEENGR